MRWASILRRVLTAALAAALIAGAGPATTFSRASRSAGGPTLTVSKGGGGTGRISSSPAGIDCGLTCSSEFAYGTSVTLSVVPAAGSSFTHWSGDCSNGGCMLVMTADHFVSATFEIDKRLTVTIVDDGGSGIVASRPSDPGIYCSHTCTSSFPHGFSVSLFARPNAGSTFAGWSGDCSGTAGCSVTMDAERAVTATFAQSPPVPVCVVPNVKGKTLASATDAIRAGNCALGKVTRAFAANVARGRVVSQRPRARTRLASGGKVALVVSKGKKPRS